MAYNPQNANGQATMANSAPVVLSSDQSIIPISTSQAIPTANTTLQNAISVTGNGTTLTVTGYGTALLLVTGVFVATINFEASSDAGVNWFPLSATFIGNADIASTGTAVGQYRLTTTGIDLIRSRVTWTSGTSITIIGRAINSINASKIVGLASGSKTIGAVTNTNLDVALSSRLKPADTLAGVTTVTAVTTITNALPVGANIIGKISIDQTTQGTTNLVTLGANQSVNTTQINGIAISTGTGIMGTGVQRIVIASDNDSLSVKQTTAANFNATVVGTGTFVVQSTPVTQVDTFMLGGINVKEINAVAPLMGNGVTGTGSQRVTIASDNTAFSTNATLSAETTKVIGTVNIAALQTIAAITAITNALPIGTNKIGTVDIATAAATAKGTQGSNAVPTQDLKDAGRNAIHFYTLIPVLTSATDTLQNLTGTKSGATVIATATPAVTTTGKTMRITRLSATYIATVTSGYAIIRLRFNTAGVVVISSPIATTLAIGASTPATANSTGSEEAILDEGWEFAAGTGIGISVQGFAAVTATAVGYILVSVTGYEY